MCRLPRERRSHCSLLLTAPLNAPISNRRPSLNRSKLTVVDCANFAPERHLESTVSGQGEGPCTGELDAWPSGAACAVSFCPLR